MRSCARWAHFGLKAVGELREDVATCSFHGDIVLLALLQMVSWIMQCLPQVSAHFSRATDASHVCFPTCSTAMNRAKRDRSENLLDRSCFVTLSSCMYSKNVNGTARTYTCRSCSMCIRPRAKNEEELFISKHFTSHFSSSLHSLLIQCK